MSAISQRLSISPRTVLFVAEKIAALDEIQRHVGGFIVFEDLVHAGHPPIVLVSPEIRAALKQITVAKLPSLIVLSYDEITTDTVVESFRIVSEAAPAAA